LPCSLLCSFDEKLGPLASGICSGSESALGLGFLLRSEKVPLGPHSLDLPVQSRNLLPRNVQIGL
jgi:hypothetical protein